MKNKRLALWSFLALAVFAFVAYFNDYELKLVPNEPDLKPRAVRPSPQENVSDFKLAGGSERENRGFPQRKIIDLTSLFPGLFYREGPTDEKKIALTFDDGPDSVYTPQILDILKKENIKATFFLIGNRAELFTDVVRRIEKEGHVIGNHTMNHPNIIKLNEAQTQQEIKEGEEALYNIINYRTALFRSPYGSLTPEKVKEVEKLDYKIIAWNVDSLDWKSLTAEQVKYNILENVKAGSIVLQHSSGSEEEDLTGSVAALEEVITILKDEGYKFVTIPELLDIQYKK